MKKKPSYNEKERELGFLAVVFLFAAVFCIILGNYWTDYWVWFFILAGVFILIEAYYVIKVKIEYNHRIKGKK